MQGINKQEKKRVRFDKQYLACPLRPYMCYVQGDLRQEISHLQTKVFPHLDSLCLARGTRFLPVDLQQNQEEGAVIADNGLVDAHSFQTACRPPALLDQRLKISLDLIGRSCFFICLLGQRYGNFLQEENGSASDIGPCSLCEVARNLHVASKAGYSWVLEDMFRTCSLTELEIIRAAFHDQHRSCFFYFKDYTPPDNTDFRSNDMLPLVNVLSTESHSERERVRNLKRRIIDRCLPVRFFRNLCELEMLIKKDWEGVISQFYGDPKYPVSGCQDLFELSYHEGYVHALCDWFVPSTQATEILNVLNTFVHFISRDTKSDTRSGDPANKESGKSVLLVCGARGCGKSTLAAHWIQAFCKQNPDVPVICHFCGISISSTDVRSVLRQWTAELRRFHYGNSPDWDGVLEDGAEPFHLMVQMFAAAVSLGPCVILVDGIDLLTETFGLTVQEVKELRWLPDALPPHCKLIITTTFTDLTYKNLTSRTDVQIVTCPGRSDPHVHRSILLKHLSLPGKELPTNVMQRIVGKKLCHLPVFLAVIGTELRSCGKQREEELELLEEYMEVESVPELCMKVILRWVKDYSRSSPTEAVSPCKATTPNITSFREDVSGWVWDTLCLIHVAHAGLTEVEVLSLLEVLGYCGNLKVEVLEWARLRSAIWPWVQEKPSGLLTIMHQSFSQAMNLLLLDSKGQGRSQNDFHQILADFFQKSSVCSWVRKMEEIPWNLMRTGSFRDLQDFLINPATVEALSRSLEQYPQLKTDLTHYWVLLKERGFDPASSFQNLIPQSCRMEGLDDVHRSTWRVSVFFSKVLLCFGETHQTEELLKQMDRIFQKDEGLDRDMLCLQLKVQHMLANLYLQMHLLKDAEIYCRKGLETAQHLTARLEVKLIVGHLLCRLCVILLEDGRLYEVPGLIKTISSARYTSFHPSSEGTLLMLKAIHKLSLNEVKAAERCLQTALASRRRWFGPDHPLVAEVEEKLADLWSSTQSDTDWVQIRIVELFRHVLSTKETEAQGSPLAEPQRDLAVVLVKFGKVLLRSCSKAERREGLELLQRASDITINFLSGHEQPISRELEHVSNTNIVGWKLSRSSSGSLLGPFKGQQTGLQHSKSHITRKTFSEERPSPDIPDCGRDETLKRPWTTLQLSVFGPQSDIKTLLPAGKTSRQTSVPRSARRSLPDRCPSTSAK